MFRNSIHFDPSIWVCYGGPDLVLLIFISIYALTAEALWNKKFIKEETWKNFSWKVERSKDRNIAKKSSVEYLKILSSYYA